MTTSDGLSTRTFVLGMVPDDGVLQAADVYDVGEACGFTVHQIRLCFARLVAEGLFRQEGRGRKAVLVATAKNRRIIAPEVEWLELAFDQDRGRAPWDGVWHLVMFSIAETERARRTALRDTLMGMGAALIAGGVYVQPNDWDPIVREAAAELGVSDNVTLARAQELEVGGSAHPEVVARRLWPLDEIAREYEQFNRRFGGRIRAGGAGEPVTALAAAIAMVSEFDRVMHLDPLLPVELLPKHWPGRRARALLAEHAGAIAELRDEIGVPALFRRYDRVLAPPRRSVERW